MVYLREKNEDKKMIGRQGMGCRMAIGDLYDAVNEQCLESSVFNNNKDQLLEKHLTQETTNHRQLKYAALENNFDLFDFLHINLELQASILAGLIKPTGAFGVLNEEFDSDKVLLKYSVRNKTTRLNIREPEVLKCISESEIRKEATHLVVGIVHGYDVVMSFEPRWVKNKAEKYNLLTVFEDFEVALKEGNARAYLNSEMKYVSTVATKVFSDVDLKTVGGKGDSLPVNYLKSSLLLLCQLEGLALSVPLVYLMLPISTLTENFNQRSQLDRYYIKPNTAKLRASIAVLKELDTTIGSFEYFYNLVDIFGHFVFTDSTYNEIGGVGKEIKSSLSKQKQRFKKWLINARTRTNTQNFQLLPSEFNPTRIALFLSKYSAARSKLMWLQEIFEKGISFSKSRTQLADFLANFEEVYLFKYESAMYETPEWNEAFSNYLDLLPGKNKFKATEETSNNVFGNKTTPSECSTVDFTSGTSYVIFESDDQSQSQMGNLFEDNGQPEKNCSVEYYLDGIIINPKVLDLFVRPSCKWDKRCPLTKETLVSEFSAVVTMPCPGFLMGRCNEKESIKWICEECGRHIQFDFVGTFFCDCGRGPIENCTFKCHSLLSGVQYLKPEKREFFNRLKNSLTPRKEINLLVMGETGVGKTTFINAFANYLTYSTLEEAEASDLIALIPASFTITGADFQAKQVTIGNDDGEIQEVGASQTQFCKCYAFPSDNRVVRIIDTPGIGDTRGVSYDETNFENILSFISNYPRIQGILLLLKPNNSRLSIFFRFCIQQLLCHLHKSASNNIVFVYTNARGTFYRPGDTHPPLRKLLLGIEQKEPYVKIKLERPTIYCLDNESFRFLVALKNGVKFDKDHKQNFSDSWVQSVTECNRLFEYVSQLTPHLVTETISLNQVRKLILTLAKPLGDISQNIQLNIFNLQDQQEKIKLVTDDISNLKKLLHVPIVDLDPVPFNHPRTVCTAPECVKIYNVDGQLKIDYAQICHDHCYLQGVQPEVINNAALMHCTAMGGSKKNCVVCKSKCPYEKHMHIYYENKPKKTEKVDDSIAKEINNKEKRVEAVQRIISQLQGLVKSLQDEQKIIMKTSAKFGQFLRLSAITPYNDALKDYMDYLISVEEQKRAVDPSKKALIDELKKMKLDYETEIRIIQSSMNEKANEPLGVDRLTLEDIKNSVDLLYRLPINGPTIQRMVDIIQRGRGVEHANVAEVVYRPRIGRNSYNPRQKRGGLVRGLMNKVQSFIRF